MALPKLSHPVHFLELPSNKKRYKFRPYLVEEQKNLLIAVEGGNQLELIQSINDVISACVEGIDTEKLSYFDFIYVYLKLYIASNGEKTTIRLPHVTDGEECNGITNVDINFENVETIFTEGHDTKIDLSDSVGVIMRYPTAIELIESIENIKSNISISNHKIFRACITTIYDQDTVYNVTDFSSEEFNEWYQSLGKTHLKKLHDFFFTMPRTVLNIDYECKGCGKMQNIQLSDFSDFFMYP